MNMATMTLMIMMIIFCSKIDSSLSLMMAIMGLLLYTHMHGSKILSLLAMFEFLALSSIILSMSLMKSSSYSTMTMFLVIAFLVCGGSLGLGLLVQLIRWGGKINLSSI